jgi:hypothetical protein
MKLIICSNHKYYDEFNKEKNKTINIKNFKERNIKIKTKEEIKQIKMKYRKNPKIYKE